ncbi:tetratricopeptide repeat protein [Novilysobacter erysipheiresistens]|uniref:Tetratricopeptide repeat protein n=1 Tax=Novilysobacter erysipheiresistens TaxID=1749332 RepID=A0ABU7YYE5_9GAMM
MRRISVPAIRFLVAITLVVMLGACATTSGQGGDYATLLGKAEADVSAGKVESALVAFDQAAKADPTRKEPWVRSAQLQFDAGNYGRAIVAAEEVLQRDPTDKVADSVLTVAGLRVASESLMRLQGNGALASDTARAEAERLAATMRATMGEGILDAGDDEPKARRNTRRRSTARRATPAAAPKVESKPAVANPFEVLGGG